MLQTLPVVTDQPLTPETIAPFCGFLQRFNRWKLSDISITSLLLWAKPLDIRQTFIGETLFFSIRYTYGKRYLMQPVYESFSPGDIENALELYPGFGFITVSEDFCELMEKAFPRGFLRKPMPGMFDYVYECAPLGDDRFFSRIDKQRFRPSYLRRLIDENDVELRWLEEGRVDFDEKLLGGFYDQINTQNELLTGEFSGISSLIEAKTAVPTARAGVLMFNGRPAGVIMCGRISDDMLDITFIKNDHRLRGSAPLLLHMAAAALKEECVYLNYQEDMGVESLRAYKQGLFPTCTLEKFELVPIEKEGERR